MPSHEIAAERDEGAADDAAIGRAGDRVGILVRDLREILESLEIVGRERRRPPAYIRPSLNCAVRWPCEAAYSSARTAPTWSPAVESRIQARSASRALLKGASGSAVCAAGALGAGRERRSARSRRERNRPAPAARRPELARGGTGPRAATILRPGGLLAAEDQDQGCYGERQISA